jgi:hypothetical protein
MGAQAGSLTCAAPAWHGRASRVYGLRIPVVSRSSRVSLSASAPVAACPCPRQPLQPGAVMVALIAVLMLGALGLSLW